MESIITNILIVLVFFLLAIVIINTFLAPEPPCEHYRDIAISRVPARCMKYYEEDR